MLSLYNYYPSHGKTKPNKNLELSELIPTSK